MAEPSDAKSPEQGLGEKLEHSIHELRAKFHHTHLHQTLHDAKVGLIHKKQKLGKFANLVNPQHRHDEAHEKACDDKRATICQSHRFASYFPERDGNMVKWYVDGRDYFWAVSMALEQAKETIYLADWWLSPEVFLRRPPCSNQEWRLDQILKRRAEAGVKIFVMVYREVEAAITCNSLHTKHALQALCPEGSPGFGNIQIMRHPDHNVLENAADMTFYWAHHEKFIVVDYQTAFVGGLDLCFGRWDNHQHALADVHGDGVVNEVWPGQDFNNNRVMDFHNVDDWRQNDLSKAEFGRMPWHDVAMGLVGPCVYDIAEHFVLRWNFVKRDKYKHDARFAWIELRGRQGDDEDLVGVQRPKHPVGDYVLHPLSPRDTPSLPPARGTVHAQIVRSSADWSSGILPDHSIQNAYSDIIRNAQHYVYMENQFFITATGNQQSPIHNTVGRSIVEAVVGAARQGRKFRVIILIPAIPGFAGDLRDDAATGTRAIMDYQYKSICRGEHSIFAQVRKQGVDPTQYIFFFNLRSYDRLDARPARKPVVAEAASSASVAACAMAGQGPVSDVAWLSDQPADEVESWVQEELYVHAKLLVVDDRIVLCGSSNLNDRSQLGYHDSELAMVMEDTRRFGTTMDGQPYEAGWHAATLRRYLWREHLGLLPPQDLDASGDANAQPPGDDSPNYVGDKDDSWMLVEDPLSDALWDMWTSRATKNTDMFRQLFHADPDNDVKTFDDYNTFLPPRGIRAGHIFDGTMAPHETREKLSQIKGHLVWYPLEFLQDANMAETGLQVNQFTESVYT